MNNQYVIIRDDLLTDPLTIITDGLLIGRLLECEILLNHPSISRVQAGIKQIEDNYYLFSLRPSNPVVLNGRPVEDNEALAPGDVMKIGPYLLEVDDTESALVIRVSLQIGMSASDTDVSSGSLSTETLVVPTDGKKAAKPRPAPVQGTKALDIFWDKRIREAGKMVRPTILFPRSQRRSGKAQFNWSPTTDLKSRWPGAIFTWGLLGVALLSLAATYKFARAYSPAPLSTAHSQSVLTLTPAIAMQPNAGACTNCHSWKGHIADRCASCHHTGAFVATVIKQHENAGVSCVDCHAEHRGSNYRAAEAAFTVCTDCHRDSNSKTYNGHHVGTPHQGSFGYPVVQGQWSLKTINEDDWESRQIPISRSATDDDQKWISQQFHALHSERLKIPAGLTGNSLGQLSCSSCHKSTNPIDRETPRTTCGICHNGRMDQPSQRAIIAANQPNCTSCHVQHVKDLRRWGTEMLWRPGN